jgi:putative ABC transport system permease protein
VSIRANIRSLARARGLSLAVTATLAVGVAALTTSFGIVHAALFREPPFDAAHEVALLYLVRDDNGVARRERWSYARSELLRQSQKSFAHVARYAPGSLSLAGDADPEMVNAERVSGDYFAVLRVRPALGRFFGAPEDDARQPAPVAVLGHALWTRRFGGDRSILGKTIRLNGVTLTVIGVMPEGFSGLSGNAEMWLPATMTPQLTYADFITTNQNFISVVGRLRPGTTLADAGSELGVLGGTINRALPSDPKRPDERVSATAVTLNEARVDKTVKRSLLILLGGVALLHLLACANVVNLLLGRAAARRRESAVRLALGSSSALLFRTLLAEGAMLASVGCALGVLIAWWMSGVVNPPANVWAPRNFYGSLAAFDAPAFGIVELSAGLALVAITVVLVAIPPALSAFRIDVAGGIKAGARGMAEGALRLARPTPRGMIVGAEAALAMLLVVVAALLIDSFRRMRGADLGIETQGVLTFWIIPSEVKVPPAAAPAFVSRVIDVVSRVPGVASVTVDGGAPVSGTASSTLNIIGRVWPDRPPPVLRHYVAPGHFSTLGIRVLRGRTFTSTDVHGAPRVTVISEGAAKKFWPNEDPLGKRVWFNGGSNFNSPDSIAEVIGIVSDVVYAPLDQQPNRASFYTSYMQFTYAARAVFVRTNRDPLSLIPDVRSALRTIDPDLAMRTPQSLEQLVTGSWARHRFDAILFGGFGITALLLAASGIFAVLAYAVGTRTREFGIRIALGARPARVVALVVREGMGFPIIGLVVGALVATASTRVLASSLYGISALEPGIFLGTLLLLLTVAILACILPAWRATRVDPTEALRAD